MRLTAYLMIMNHVLLDDIDLISAKNFSVTGSNLSCANDECRVPYGPPVCADAGYICSASVSGLSALCRPSTDRADGVVPRRVDNAVCGGFHLPNRLPRDALSSRDRLLPLVHTDHGRWVSMPRCAWASSHVPSTDRHLTTHGRTGPAVPAEHSFQVGCQV